MAVFNNFHNEQILKLDVKQQQPNKIPRFVQYDSALLKIELYDNGKLYDVSRADEFVVSAKRPDGSKVSGLAEYDGEFVTYKLSKQDLEMLGETDARLQIYEGRNRLSSLSFRYDVYEDYEAVGNPDDVTLLSALLQQVRDALADAQRQGGYAENRGDFANAAGDFANSAGDSQKMRWLKWVKTIAERNSTYRNPRNGDTVYVVNVADKNGGAVYRYNAIERPHKWEEISGWDTSIIQDIYNMLGDLEDKKETKVKVAQLVKQLQEDLANTRIGANNIIKQTDTSITSNDVIYSPVTSNSEVSVINTTTGHGRVVQARLPANANQSYYGATIGNSASRRFSVQEGETLTLSFLGAKSLTATDFTYVYLMRTDGTNKAMTLLRKHDLDASSYDKYEFTVTAPWSSDNAYLLIGSNKRSEYGDDNAFWIRFKDVSLVRGNRAADWAPSFDDLVKNAQDLVKEVCDELNDKITKHNSRISVLEDKITMTVTETSYDSKMKQIAQWQSEYEQTAREITTTVNKKVGTTELISTINQSAEEVKINASSINLNGDLIVENGKVKVRQLTSSSGVNKLALNSKNLIMQNDKGELDIGADGVIFTNKSGSVRYQMNPTLVTSSAFGTSNNNVYLAPMDNGEARVVKHSDVPGNGMVGSYRYLPVRASGFYGNFWNIGTDIENVNNIHLYARPFSGGELRITLNGRTTNYQNVRADWYYGNRFIVNSLKGANNHLYLGTVNGGELRVVHSDSSDVYRAVRARDYFTDTSERKLKKNIEEYEADTLDTFRQAKVYTYNRLDDDENEKPQLGMMLDEMPSETYSSRHDSFGLYGLTSYVAKGVKDLIEVTDSQNESIQKLEAEKQELKRRLDNLEKLLIER